MKNLRHVEEELRDNDTALSQTHEALWNGTQWYQEATKEFALYPEDRALAYLTLGLSSEAGEVAGKLKKWIRGDYDWNKLHADMKAEMGDVFWYLSQLCNHFGWDMQDVMEDNIRKLRERKRLNTIKGSGDDR
jgi:NTP pyrophosphatase (non-canonical NTP hydrolase)